MQNKVLYFVSILFFLSACSPVYRPNVTNIPMMESGGDVQASGHFGTNGNDVQLAYSPIDHLVVLANGNWYANDFAGTDDERRFNHHESYEGGVGYYNHFGDGGVFGANGGYGHGFINAFRQNPFNYYDYLVSGKVRFKGSYNRYFLQPYIGMHGDVFDGGFTPRISLIDYYGIEAKNEVGEKIHNVPENYNVFVEPAFTSRVGYKFVKFQAQIGVSIPMPISNNQLLLDYQPFMFSIGIHFDIEKAYMKGE